MALSAQLDRFVHERLPASEAMPVLRFDAPELQFPEKLNLVERLLDDALNKGWADAPMLRAPGTLLTYAQAAARVDAIAQVLMHDCGLVPGNRILLRGGNSIGPVMNSVFLMDRR